MRFLVQNYSFSSLLEGVLLFSKLHNSLGFDLLQGSFSIIGSVEQQIGAHLLHRSVLDDLHALTILVVVVGLVPHQLDKFLIHFGIAFVLFVDTLQKLLF